MFDIPLLMPFLRTVSFRLWQLVQSHTQQSVLSCSLVLYWGVHICVIEHMFGATFGMCSFLFPLMFQEIPSEWHLELMLNRGLPEELWVHYVQQLHSAQRVAMEDSVLLVFSLKCFIFALKAPKSFPTGKARS